MASHVVRRSRRVGVAASLLVVLAAPLPAWAQRESGPYADLFAGSGGGEEGIGTSLQLHGALFGTWDDVIVRTEDRDALNSRFLDDRMGAGGSARLSYVRSSTTRRFSTDAGSDVRLFPGVAPLSAVDHRLSAAFDGGIGRYLTLGAHGGGAYSSFYTFAPFLDEGGADVGATYSSFAFAAAAEPNTTVSGDATLTLRTSRRTGLSAGARWSESRFLDRPEYTLDLRGANGAFHYDMSRVLRVRAGYDYYEARYQFGGGERVIVRGIDVGADYRDALEVARRTALSFSASTLAASIEDHIHYRVNGDARLVRGFRRTWSTYVGFVRDLDFVAGFPEPVLSDAVRIGLGGLLHPRVSWRSGAAYARGGIGFESRNPFFTYSGTTRVQLGVTRRLGVYGQYTYYVYDVPRGSGAAQLVPHFARQAASVGLAAWLPIVSDMRSTRDTR